MSRASSIQARRGALALTPGLWVVDPGASSVAFSVPHFGVATVHGGFTRFEGWLEVDRQGGGRAGGRVDAASIDTGMRARDERLRSAGCFDVASHPAMTFEADLVASRQGFGLDGELTIMARPNRLVLACEVTSFEPGWAVVTARGVLRRREIGLQLEGGSAVLGDRVSIRLDVTLGRQP